MRQTFFLGLIISQLVFVKPLWATIIEIETLSENAEISLLTCEPGNELYEAFGHSAVWVYDPATGTDEVFNYGIFEFDVPNFYLNFARGYLKYRLGTQSIHSFMHTYVPDKRTVTQQLFNLNTEEKQALYQYLKINALPENRYYYYDYFTNNCATKIHDVLEDQLPNRIRFSAHPSVEKESFRSLIHRYAYSHAWGLMGIDLCLGSGIDKPINDRNYEFLPDYLMRSFDSSFIDIQGVEYSFVSKKNVLNQGIPREKQFDWFQPLTVTWTLFVIVAILGLWALKNRIYMRLLDVFLFLVSGLVGILLLLLWFGTNHVHTAMNFNLLWAFPANLVLALLLIFKYVSRTVIYYYFFYGAILTILVLTWTFLPQKMNQAFFPLVLIMLYRCGINCYRLLYEINTVHKQL